MNSITRLLAVAGIGLAAGVSIGAGPAQAAPESGRAVSGTAHWNDDSDVIGYFSSPIRCERVGRLGEIRDRWDDYDCYRVRYGFHRGDWALEVSSGRWGGAFRPDCPPDGFDGGFGHHGDGGFGPGFHGRQSA